jgi:hypothetical protein
MGLLYTYRRRHSPVAVAVKDCSENRRKPCRVGHSTGEKPSRRALICKHTCVATNAAGIQRDRTGLQSAYLVCLQMQLAAE